MWAASEGNTAAAEMLIEFGAGVKAKSKGGWFTPLLFAVRNGHKQTVQALLAHGANANDVAPDGTSALNMAVVGDRYELSIDGRRIFYGPMPPADVGGVRQLTLDIQTVGLTGAFSDVHWQTAGAK